MSPRTETGREFEKLWAEEIEKWEDEAVHGRCATFERYKFVAGVLAGFRLSAKLFDKAERTVLRIPDDEEND